MMHQRILVGATARPRLAKPSAEMSPRIVSAKIPSCLCWYPETVWALCLSSCVCSALFGSFRVNLRMMQNPGRISVPARGTAGHSWAASPNARWAPAKVRAAPQLGSLEGFFIFACTGEEFHNCSICSTSLWGCSLNRRAGELLIIVHNSTGSISMKVWGRPRSNWEPQKLIYTFYLRICASFVTRLRPWAEFSPCANFAAELSVTKAVIFHFL